MVGQYDVVDEEVERVGEYELRAHRPDDEKAELAAEVELARVAEELGACGREHAHERYVGNVGACGGVRLEIAGGERHVGAALLATVVSVDVVDVVVEAHGVERAAKEVGHRHYGHTNERADDQSQCALGAHAGRVAHARSTRRLGRANAHSFAGAVGGCLTTGVRTAAADVVVYVVLVCVGRVGELLEVLDASSATQAAATDSERAGHHEAVVLGIGERHAATRQPIHVVYGVRGRCDHAVVVVVVVVVLLGDADAATDVVFAGAGRTTTTTAACVARLTLVVVALAVGGRVAAADARRTGRVEDGAELAVGQRQPDVLHDRCRVRLR